MPQLDNSLPPGLAGFMATRQANQQSDQSNLSSMTGVAGLLAKLQEQERMNRFRSEMAGATTPDEQARVASKYASPADIFKRTQESADVKARVEATKGSYLLANETRRASIENSRAIANQNFMLNMARINVVGDETKRKVLRDEELKRHDQELERLKRMAADPLGINPPDPVPSPQPAPMQGGNPQSQAAPRPSVAMQETAPAMAARDQAAPQVIAGNTPSGSGPAIPTNTLVPSVPPPSGMLQTAGPATPAPAVPQPQQQPAPTTGNRFSGLTGDKLYEALPPNVAQEVKSRVEGLRAPFGNMQRNNPRNQQVMDLVMQADPTYNDSRFKTRQNYLNFGPEKTNLTNLNQAYAHAGTLSDLATEMKNGNWRAPNSVFNWFKSQAGNSSVTNPQIAMQALSEELMRTFRGAGQASVEEAKAFHKALSTMSGSPEQQQGALKTAVDLLDKRFRIMEEQYVQGMGHERFKRDLLLPTGKAAYEKLHALPKARRAGDNAAANPALDEALSRY